MADGTTKEIADVRIGDEVLATDPATGVTSSRKVTDTMIHIDDNLMDLVVKTDSGIDTIHTTDNHRVWNASQRSWVAVENLKTGDKLKTVNSLHAYVERLTRVEGQRSMHDLSVEIDHTFYVDGGNGPVLVHNAGRGVAAPFPLTGGPQNGTLYRYDVDGNITNFARYDNAGNILRRVDLTGVPHKDIPTPHSLAYDQNMRPSGEVTPRPQKTVTPGLGPAC